MLYHNPSPGGWGFRYYLGHQQASKHSESKEDISSLEDNSSSENQHKVELTLSSVAERDGEDLVTHGHMVARIGDVSWKVLAEVYALPQEKAYGRLVKVAIILGAFALAGCYLLGVQV